MANKKWKTRWRNLMKDKAFQKIHFAFGFMLLLTSGISFVTKDFFNSPFIVTLFGIGLCGAFHTYELFFREKSIYGEEDVNQEEAQHIEEEIENEQENTYVDDVSTWHAKRERMLSLAIGEDSFFHSYMVHMIETMQYIIESCSLSDEQKKYFMHDFPDEMCEILHTYGKLQGEYRKKMETDILQLMHDKRKEWHRTYVEPLQQELTVQCTKQIQHAYRKKEEKIYITD